MDILTIFLPFTHILTLTLRLSQMFLQVIFLVCLGISTGEANFFVALRGPVLLILLTCTRTTVHELQRSLYFAVFIYRLCRVWSGTVHAVVFGWRTFCCWFHKLPFALQIPAALREICHWHLRTNLFRPWQFQQGGTHMVERQHYGQDII